MALRVLGLVVVMCVINPWLLVAVLPLIIVMATLQVFGARTLRGMCQLRESGEFGKSMHSFFFICQLK